MESQYFAMVNLARQALCMGQWALAQARACVLQCILVLAISCTSSPALLRCKACASQTSPRQRSPQRGITHQHVSSTMAALVCSVRA